MIQKLSHTTIYVLDQDAAYDFYVNKLGLEVRTDAKMGNGFRWLTVGPKGQPELDAGGFLKMVREKAKLVKIGDDLLKRPVNEGFSGGEKKRNEILQMAVLEPTLAILDETDSGLDIDALKIVAHGVNRLRRPDNAIILVTHYQRILNYVEPDHVHVLVNGRIVKSAGKELALELERKGYDWIKEAPAA